MAFGPWDIYGPLDLLRRLAKPFYTEYKLVESPKAHEDLERGTVFGRAVLTP